MAIARRQVVPALGGPSLPALVLDRGTAVPLAAQLAAALRKEMLEGRLRERDRLPSTRALAARLGVSRTVTAAAYEELHAEGWLDGRVGAGTFVAARPPRPIAGHRAPQPVTRQDAAGIALHPLVDLGPGQPWVAGIDRAAWRRAWRRAADLPPAEHRRPAGADGYRRCVAETLLAHRGLVVDRPLDPDGVLATAGTSAAVAELAVAVLRPGDVVAVEDPGYGRAVASLRAAGVEVVPAPIDAEGLDPDGVPAGVRAVYCSPAHQYPLGARMPVARRVRLVERAREHAWLVVEDDYDGELRFDVAPPPVLAALDRDVVVHLGTTSKILSPTLGCGWMVAPSAVAERVLEHRRRTSIAPAVPGQQMLVEFARTGDLGRHLRRVRRELAARRSLLVAELAAGGVEVPGVDAGAHVVVRLPDEAAERAALDAGSAAGLRFDPLSRHFHSSVPQHGLVIGYGGPARDRLPAIARVVLATVP
jgi:GntR family transcriptional regulator / MocR family aminotransferase